jgi:abortive infection bacteriophage resistance protein
MVKRPSMLLNNPAGAWLANPLKPVQLNKPFAVISCMVYLCKYINRSDDIKQKITDLIHAYPNVPVYRYGFFNNWRNEPLWE